MIAGKEQYVVIDTDSSKDVDPIVFEIIKYAFSYITFTVLALLVALILFGMIRNSYTQGLTCAGIVFIVLGGAVTVLAILASTGAIIGSLVGDTVIDTIIGGVFKVNLLPAIIVLVSGILMLTLRFVIKRQISKKKKTA